MFGSKDPHKKLYNAIRAGSLSAVETALAAGADINAQLKNGQTALMHAIKTDDPKANIKERLAIARWLLEKGADPDMQETGYNGWNALLLATWYNNAEGVRLLLEFKADPDYWDVNKKTPLHYAAEAGRTEIVRLLLEAGADTLPRTSSSFGSVRAIDLSKNPVIRNMIAAVMKTQEKDIPQHPDAPEQNPAVPAAASAGDPDIVLIRTPVNESSALCEVFNFARRERFSYMEHDGKPATPPVYASFDDLAEKQKSVLSDAFKKHRAQGGARPESVIEYNGKNAEHLPDGIALRRPRTAA